VPQPSRCGSIASRNGAPSPPAVVGPLGVRRLQLDPSGSARRAGGRAASQSRLCFSPGAARPRPGCRVAPPTACERRTEEAAEITRCVEDERSPGRRRRRGRAPRGDGQAVRRRDQSRLSPRGAALGRWLPTQGRSRIAGQHGAAGRGSQEEAGVAPVERRGVSATRRRRSIRGRAPRLRARGQKGEARPHVRNPGSAAGPRTRASVPKERETPIISPCDSSRVRRERSARSRVGTASRQRGDEGDEEHPDGRERRRSASRAA